MDRVLYFPYISVPNSSWMSRTLLYWDKVGSIVPFEFVDRPQNLTPFMRELISAELVQQIFPSQYISKVPNFNNSFIDLLDKKGKTIETTFKHGVSHKRVGVHLEKLQDIGDELVKRRLATRARGPWYYVDDRIAYMFMTYLASIIGVVAKYQPITDRMMAIENLSGQNETLESADIQIRESLRAKIIDNILPGPTQIEDIYDLYKFKEKYGNQLIKFRNSIELFLLDLESRPADQREERIKRFLIEARLQMKEIEARLKENKWSVLSVGTLCSLASSAIPIVKAFQTKNSVEAVAAIPGIISAICSALSQDQVNDLQCRPLAYAVMVNQRFPVNNR